MTKDNLSVTLDIENIEALKDEAATNHLDTSTQLNQILWQRYEDRRKKK